MAKEEFRALRFEFDLLRRRYENTGDIEEKRLITEQVVKLIGQVNKLIKMETERLDSFKKAFFEQGVREPELQMDALSKDSA